MINKEQIKIIVEAMKPFKPSKIGIFGSVARNEESPESDIDILYQFNETIGLFKLIQLQEHLQKKLNRKVDLISEKYLHPQLKSHVLNEVKIIYGN